MSWVFLWDIDAGLIWKNLGLCIFRLHDGFDDFIQLLRLRCLKYHIKRFWLECRSKVGFDRYLGMIATDCVGTGQWLHDRAAVCEINPGSQLGTP